MFLLLAILCCWWFRRLFCRFGFFAHLPRRYLFQFSYDVSPLMPPLLRFRRYAIVIYFWLLFHCFLRRFRQLFHCWFRWYFFDIAFIFASDFLISPWLIRRYFIFHFAFIFRYFMIFLHYWFSYFRFLTLYFAVSKYAYFFHDIIMPWFSLPFHADFHATLIWLLRWVFSFWYFCAASHIFFAEFRCFSLFIDTLSDISIFFISTPLLLSYHWLFRHAICRLRRVIDSFFIFSFHYISAAFSFICHFSFFAISLFHFLLIAFISHYFDSLIAFFASYELFDIYSFRYISDFQWCRFDFIDYFRRIAITPSLPLIFIFSYASPSVAAALAFLCGFAMMAADYFLHFSLISPFLLRRHYFLALLAVFFDWYGCLHAAIIFADFDFHFSLILFFARYAILPPWLYAVSPCMLWYFRRFHTLLLPLCRLLLLSPPYATWLLIAAEAHLSDIFIFRCCRASRWFYYWYAASFACYAAFYFAAITFLALLLHFSIAAIAFTPMFTPISHCRCFRLFSYFRHSAASSLLFASLSSFSLLLHFMRHDAFIVSISAFLRRFRRSRRRHFFCLHFASFRHAFIAATLSAALLISLIRRRWYYASYADATLSHFSIAAIIAIFSFSFSPLIIAAAFVSFAFIFIRHCRDYFRCHIRYFSHISLSMIAAADC